ncbi:MAG: DUF1700 domain-containing protein, partial [Anaerovoracaceae bacterium]
MNRKKFIDILKEELSKLPDEEIDAAIEYYEEYFDEAGAENEEEVLSELGSPKKVASQIKSEYAVRLLDSDEVHTARKGFSAVKWTLIGICSAPISIPVIIVLITMVIVTFTVFISVAASLLLSLIAAAAASIGALVLGVLAIPVAISTSCFFIGCGLMGLGISVILGYLVIKGVRLAVSAARLTPLITRYP